MNNPSSVLVLVQNIQRELSELGICCKSKTEKEALSNRFDEVITNRMLHKKRKSFLRMGTMQER